jgi:hypothetical protein
MTIYQCSTCQGYHDSSDPPCGQAIVMGIPMVPATELERAERECAALRHALMLRQGNAIGLDWWSVVDPVGHPGEGYFLEGLRLYYATNGARNDTSAYHAWFERCLPRKGPKPPLPALAWHNAKSPCCGGPLCGYAFFDGDPTHASQSSDDPNALMWRQCIAVTDGRACLKWIPCGVRQIEWSFKDSVFEWSEEALADWRTVRT